MAGRCGNRPLRSRGVTRNPGALRRPCVHHIHAVHGVQWAEEPQDPIPDVQAACVSHPRDSGCLSEGKAAFEEVDLIGHRAFEILSVVDIEMPDGVAFHLSQRTHAFCHRETAGY